ncbi:MAG: galactose-1-phosphate uridylyltransferase [Planctomycetes bacterium]|nr:galactose-1-phosphate uridylyltransferase [Planctomycetota bacterium]
MPELRIDPIAGRKVLIAEDRAGRPNDFESAGASSCPFCAGHEQRTPRSLLEISDGQGGWQVRVIPNLYPAVSLDCDKISNDSSFQASGSQPAYGTHEVIVESPRHIQDITELSTEELAQVLLVYRDRLQHWSEEKSIQHATVFKNVGRVAGASLEHIHSQLVALPFVPEVIANEIRGAKQFYERKGTCIFCRLLQEELEQGERLVGEEGPFVAFCAYAGRQPFETWVLPKQHASHFKQLTDDEAHSLASLLQQVVCRLQTQLKPLSYNLILHTAPFGDQTPDSYHWHLEIIPRTAQLAGFEWGAGVHINSLLPERAAKLLREAIA